MVGAFWVTIQQILWAVEALVIVLSAPPPVGRGWGCVADHPASAVGAHDG